LSTFGSSPGVRVVQMAGSWGGVERIRNPGELARILADRLGGTYHALFAPAFVESPELRDALLREPGIRATVGLFDRVSVAIVGIGAYAGGRRSSSSLVQAHVLSQDDLGRLLAAGSVGDLILYPFDARGRFVADQLAGRAVAITPAQLARIPRVIAVAGGAKKGEAIAAALATGIVKILVTDEPAAEQVVAIARREAHAGGARARSRP
jgi:deoxyribonucleoside regulator